MGELDILHHKIPCAVLDDGRRVLSDRGMRAALAIKMTGSRKNAGDSGSLEMPVFLAQNNLKPFISKGFVVRSISYQPVKGPAVNGYEASLLPRVCQIYLAARRAGKLHKSQEHIAEVCEILIGRRIRARIFFDRFVLRHCTHTQSCISMSGLKIPPTRRSMVRALRATSNKLFVRRA